MHYSLVVLLLLAFSILAYDTKIHAFEIQPPQNLPIENLLQKLEPSSHDTENLDDFPQGSIEKFSVDNTEIPAPSSSAELLLYLKTIHFYLNSCTRDSVEIRYGQGHTYHLRLPFLGQGQNGAVYEILGSNPKMVIKIPHPTPKAINACKSEHRAYRFWRRQVKNQPFRVPFEFGSNKFGLFRVMEKIEGETLTKVLIREGLLLQDLNHPYHIKVSYHPQQEPSYKIRQIMHAISAMLKILVSNPHMCTSISPNNILVHPMKRSKPNNLNITLVDIGVTSGKITTYQKISSFEEYLTLAANRLEKYLSSPVYSYDRDHLLNLLKESINDDLLKKSDTYSLRGPG